MDNLYFRAIIFHYCKKGYTFKKIEQKLKILYNNHCPSHGFIHKWINRYICGEKSLKDNVRSGRPQKSDIKNYCKKIEKIIKEDPYVSAKNIASSIKEPVTKTRKYINNQLGYKKLMNKWVPYELTNEHKIKRIKFCKNFINKYKSKSIYWLVTGDETYLRYFDPKTGNQAKQWVHKNNDLPEIRLKKFVAKKVLVSVFFSKTGIKSITFLYKKKRADSRWYKYNCLKKMVITLKKNNKKIDLKKIKIHHDNAPIHKSRMVKTYLNKNHIKSLEHPPYSPDLSPCDFWLFPKVKQLMKGQKFETEKEIKKKFEFILNKLTIKDFNICFDIWKKRCEEVLYKNGNYY